MTNEEGGFNHMIPVIDIVISALLIYGIILCRKSPTVDNLFRIRMQWVLILLLVSLFYDNISVIFISNAIDYLRSKGIEPVSQWTAYILLPAKLSQLAAYIILIVAIYKKRMDIK
jgi:hypothetical protein